MSEIKDKVSKDIHWILLKWLDIYLEHKPYKTGEITEQILSIPEIAIVDREALLPSNPYGARTNQEVYQRAIEDFKKEGWIKEVQ